MKRGIVLVLSLILITIILMSLVSAAWHSPFVDFFKNLFKPTGKVISENCPSGIISYWKFEEASGTTTIDSIGGNNGILNGATWTSGKLGNALSFDGNDYVSVPDSASLDITNDITISAWIKIDSFPNSYPRILAKNNAYDLFIDTSSKKMQFAIYNQSGSRKTVKGNTVLSTNTQYYVTGVYHKASGFKLYINGVEESLTGDTSFRGNIKVSTNSLLIGNFEGLARYFSGMIDELAIYNRALSASEIIEHYNSGAGKDYCTAQPQQNCTDSDGGRNYYIRGDISGVCQDCNPPAIGGNSDLCTNSTNLMEFYCINSTSWIREVVACPNGCLNGACVNVTNVTCPSGIISYWKFNGNFQDSADNNHGTVSGAIISAGKLGTGAGFDGVNDYVKVSDSANLDMATRLTVEAWVYPVSYKNWDRLVVKPFETNVAPWSLWGLTLKNDTPRTAFFSVAFVNGSSAGVSTTSSVPLNQWTHLVGTYDGSRVRIYLNGVEQGSKQASGNLKTNNRDVYFGYNYYSPNGNQHFNGRLDEIAIYNRALSASEIIEHYNSGVGKDYCGQPVCVNECYPNGNRTCGGSGYKTCGNYDSDACLEWSSVTNCLANQICVSGACVNVTQTCIDSDGGINYFVRGSASGINGNFTDYCINSTRLREYYCNASRDVISNYYTCINGCLNGACLNITTNVTNLTIKNVSFLPFRIETGDTVNIGIKIKNNLNSPALNILVRAGDQRGWGDYKIVNFSANEEKSINLTIYAREIHLTYNPHIFLITAGRELVNINITVYNKTIKRVNASISIATIKNNYLRGEKIELTDPPSDNLNVESGNIVEGSNVYRNIVNNNEQKIYSQLEISEQAMPKFSGYIVEFEDEPIVKRRANLLKEAEKNKEYIDKLSPVNPVKYYMQIFSVTPDKVDSRVEDYARDLKNSHNKAKDRVLGKLNTITGQAISETDGNSFVEIIKKLFKLTGKAVVNENSEKKVLSEYTKVFNGIALDVSAEEAENIKKVQGVKEVYPNLEVQATLMDSVPLINVDDVWNMQDSQGRKITGTGIKIAILDTGIDHTHPDLQGKVILEEDFVVGNDPYCGDGDDDDIAQDDYGHGTHVAGIAAGNGALKGVAPNANLIIGKVLGPSGCGYWNWIIEGIEWAADPNNDGNFSDHADIISMSLGGEGNPDDAISQAVDNAVDAGVVAVISAGNSGPEEGTIGSPGTARKAITVGASYKKDYTGTYWRDNDPRLDQIVSFSSRGPVIWFDNLGNRQYIIKPDVVAPGAIICAAQYDSAWNDRKCFDNAHVEISGTSMAAPHVAGAAALIKQAHPDWTPEEIKMALRSSTINIGQPINTQGYGRINVSKAINISEPIVVRLITNGEIKGMADIFGEINGNNFKNYTLYYGIGYDPSNWIIIESSIQMPVNNFISNINTGIFPSNNIINFKLVVYDTLGNSWIDRSIIIPNNLNIKSPDSDLYNNRQIIEINGTAFSIDFINYTITYYKLGQNTNNVGISLVNGGRSTVVEGVLGYLDTSQLESGIYNLTLTMNSVSGVSRYEVKFGYEPRLIKKIKALTVYKGPISEFPGWTWSFFEPTIYDLDEDGKTDFILPYLDKVNVFNIDGNLSGWPYQGDLYSCFRFGSLSLMQYPAAVIHTLTGNRLVLSDICNTLILDENGNLINKIVEKSGRHISLFKNDGKMVIGFNDEFNHSITLINSSGKYLNNWPIPLEYQNYFFNYGIGDINNDGNPDIIIRTPDHLKAFDLEGNLLFDKNVDPVEVYAMNWDNIIIADIDNDENKEIIYAKMDVGFFNNSIQVFNSNGTMKQGWPIVIHPSQYGGLGSISIGDVNGDSYPEIIFKEYNRIAIFNYSGGLIGDIPVNLHKGIGLFTSTIDINDDGKDELIYIDKENGAYLLKVRNLDNSFSDSYILDLVNSGMGVTFNPMVGDFNGDGKTEISLSHGKTSFKNGELEISNYISIYPTDFVYYENKTKWQMFQHDPQHTGCYNCEETITPRPQSKITNNQNTNITANLTIKIQKLNSGTWQNYSTPVNRQITIPARGLIKLDSMFNPLNVTISSVGNYRVYAALTSNNIVLKDLQNNLIEANYEFAVS